MFQRFLVTAFVTWSVIFAAAFAASAALHAARSSDVTATATGASGVAALPPGRPPLSQASVDLAMGAFGIAAPPWLQGPFFDPSLADRGLTVSRELGLLMVVAVGPPAFTSWAMLGSTLAHEVEIHARQNHFAMVAMDRMGAGAIASAEREAYSHEIAGAARFGLSESEAVGISVVRDRLFPVARHDFERPRYHRLVERIVASPLSKEGGASDGREELAGAR